MNIYKILSSCLVLLISENVIAGGTLGTPAGNGLGQALGEALGGALGISLPIGVVSVLGIGALSLIIGTLLVKHKKKH